MSRFDVECFVKPPDPELICCICQCVLDDAVESPCRHVFCRACVTRWLDANFSCPTCRTVLIASDLQPVLPLIQNMIGKLEIRCKQFNNGCTKVFTIDFFDEDHQLNCEYRFVKCKHSKCERDIIAKDLASHQESCDWKEIVCSRVCGLKVLARDVKEHNCVTALKNLVADLMKTVEYLKTEVLDLRDRLRQTEHGYNLRNNGDSATSENYSDLGENFSQGGSPSFSALFHDSHNDTEENAESDGSLNLSGFTDSDVNRESANDNNYSQDESQHTFTNYDENSSDILAEESDENREYGDLANDSAHSDSLVGFSESAHSSVSSEHDTNADDNHSHRSRHLENEIQSEYDDQSDTQQSTDVLSRQSTDTASPARSGVSKYKVYISVRSQGRSPHHSDYHSPSRSPFSPSPATSPSHEQYERSLPASPTNGAQGIESLSDRSVNQSPDEASDASPKRQSPNMSPNNRSNSSCKSSSPLSGGQLSDGANRSPQQVLSDHESSGGPQTPKPDSLCSEDDDDVNKQDMNRSMRVTNSSEHKLGTPGIFSNLDSQDERQFSPPEWAYDSTSQHSLQCYKQSDDSNPDCPETPKQKELDSENSSSSKERRSWKKTRSQGAPSFSLKLQRRNSETMLKQQTQPDSSSEDEAAHSRKRKRHNYNEDECNEYWKRCRFTDSSGHSSDRDVDHKSYSSHSNKSSQTFRQSSALLSLNSYCSRSDVSCDENGKKTKGLKIKNKRSQENSNVDGSCDAVSEKNAACSDPMSGTVTINPAACTITNGMVESQKSEAVLTDWMYEVKSLEPLSLCSTLRPLPRSECSDSSADDTYCPTNSESDSPNDISTTDDGNEEEYEVKVPLSVAQILERSYNSESDEEWLP